MYIHVHMYLYRYTLYTNIKEHIAEGQPIYISSDTLVKNSPVILLLKENLPQHPIITLEDLQVILPSNRYIVRYSTQISSLYFMYHSYYLSSSTQSILIYFNLFNLSIYLSLLIFRTS